MWNKLKSVCPLHFSLLCWAMPFPLDLISESSFYHFSYCISNFSQINFVFDLFMNIIFSFFFKDNFFSAFFFLNGFCTIFLEAFNFCQNSTIFQCSIIFYKYWLYDINYWIFTIIMFIFRWHFVFLLACFLLICNLIILIGI